MVVHELQYFGLHTREDSPAARHKTISNKKTQKIAEEVEPPIADCKEALIYLIEVRFRADTRFKESPH